MKQSAVCAGGISEDKVSDTWYWSNKDCKVTSLCDEHWETLWFTLEERGTWHEWDAFFSCEISNFWFGLARRGRRDQLSTSSLSSPWWRTSLLLMLKDAICNVRELFAISLIQEIYCSDFLHMRLSSRWTPQKDRPRPGESGKNWL